MTIELSTENGVTVVTFTGRLDAPAAPEAEQAFQQLLEEGARHVILDFSGVEYISSGGIRVIVLLARGLEAADGGLKLCNLNPFVSEVFKITNLDHVYDIRSDRTAALAAFQNDGI